MELVPGTNADIDLIDFESFAKYIEFFNFEKALRYLQEASLVFTNRIRLKESLTDFRDPPRGDLYVFITRDAHAFIAKCVVLYAKQSSKEALTREDYKWLVVSYFQLKTDLTFIDTKDNDAYKYAIRVQNLQFRYWYIYGDIAGRFIIMFGLDGAKEINEMCKETLGLSFQEFLTIGICIYADMQTRRQLNFKMLVENTIDNEMVKSTLTYEKIKIFCDTFSTSKEQFSQINERFKSAGARMPLQTYEFNPLHSYPLIQTEKNYNNGSSLLVPSIPDLVYASCEGVYYKLMDKYKGADKKNIFSGRFGKVFEEYILHLLTLTNIKFFTENDLIENPKKLDALLIFDKKRVHLEVKKNKMSVLAKACIDLELEKYIDRMTDENIFSQLYEKSLSNSINLLICMDELFFFEEKVKPIIESKLKKKKNYKDEFKFHLVGIRDFEYIIDCLVNTNTSFIEMLEIKQDKYYYASFTTLISDYYKYLPSETSYLQKEYTDFYHSLYSKSNS